MSQRSLKENLGSRKRKISGIEERERQDLGGNRGVMETGRMVSPLTAVPCFLIHSFLITGTLLRELVRAGIGLLKTNMDLSILRL